MHGECHQTRYLDELSVLPNHTHSQGLITLGTLGATCDVIERSSARRMSPNDLSPRVKRSNQRGQSSAVGVA